MTENFNPHPHKEPRDLKSSELGIFLIMMAVLVYAAWHCPAIHAQGLTRRRAANPVLYCLVLFANPRATGIQFRGETLTATLFNPEVNTTPLRSPQQVINDAHGCACSLRMVFAVPAWRIGEFLAVRVDGISNGSFFLLPVEILGWYVEP